MGEAAMPIRRRIELSIAETRLRFQQLVRLTGLTGQITVVVDGGRPIAAIVPAADVLDPPPAPPPPRPAPENSAGWLRRIEKVREDVRRQHAGRIHELSQALDEAWQMLDALHPPGTDRHVDTLRAAHRDLRSSR
jgi:antitoxin (DNA-binding transcriptional repressor) of toxin-antitoxin stability system